MTNMLPFILLFLLSVLISTISQVLLKKSAISAHKSFAHEYLNPFVIVSYALLIATTIITVFAYRGIPLSYGPILETSSYLFITFFGVTLFKEKMSLKKVLALALIIAGIIVYSTGIS